MQISVIVPVYNSEKILRRCIDSILAQTFTDFELLLVNDGSTDFSGIICDEYAKKDTRVRVFHKENGGVSSARNLGLDNALGKWIVFCDSDDCVFPNWLENFAIDSEKVDLICQGIECTRPMCGEQENNNTYIYGVYFEGGIGEGLYKLIKQGIVGYVYIKCFKKSLIDKYQLRFNHHLTIQEDEEFVLRYMMICDIMKSTDLIGYHYETPNLATKYLDLQKQYEVNKLLYNIVKVNNGGVWENIVKYYMWFYVYEFILMFQKESHKHELLLEFRKNVGNDIMRTQLYFLTKWIIYIDVTGYISTFILDIHLRIKNAISTYKK